MLFNNVKQTTSRLSNYMNLLLNRASLHQLPGITTCKAAGSFNNFHVLKYFSSFSIQNDEKKNSIFSDLTTVDNNTKTEALTNRIAEGFDAIGSHEELPASKTENNLEDIDEETAQRIKLVKETEKAKKRIQKVEDDPELVEFNKKFIINQAADDLLSPLKRKVYLANVGKFGFFKNNQNIQVEGKSYVLNLTKEEIQSLEPSIYLKSFRLIGSTKKALHIVRLLRGLTLKAAIAQTQFIEKKVAKEFSPILESAIETAKTYNLNANDLYVSEIWAGSDGETEKGLDPKNKGRFGIKRFRRHHIKAVLRTSQTLKRLNYEKLELQKKKKPAFTPLRNLGITTRQSQFMKW
ncbi:mitochondrial 54S ribosomal protein uL22m [Ascoidea rubescens DSM 1968]|uniref:Ribosomal protein L22 n=1 Tax=Ascoidea rubescens DSM 1968 TaxID=1344418 RepID=A0A1D2VB99_9ASCO|nr:ribosomal protein L22 [Ascoidea rubescens DSM 1968]ODV58743.1 ribosomal protein L22 [Ascoidea rubescens DSM 1968]